MIHAARSLACKYLSGCFCSNNDQITTKSEPVANLSKTTPRTNPEFVRGVAVRKPQNGLPIFFEKIFDPSRNPKKVGSKRERRERVASAFTSEQRRRRVTFFGKGGTVERVTDFLLIL